MDRIWSKVKKAFEEQLAMELRKRLQVHVASYPSGGRGWIIFDGMELVSVEAPGWTLRVLGHSTCQDFVDGDTVELGRACGELPQLPITEALASPNPLLRGLAILDARCGKRRLQKLRDSDLDSFSATMLAVRDISLGRKPGKVVCERCGTQLELSAHG
jgi:hypothetical protein